MRAATADDHLDNGARSRESCAFGEWRRCVLLDDKAEGERARHGAGGQITGGAVPSRREEDIGQVSTEAQRIPFAGSGGERGWTDSQGQRSDKSGGRTLGDPNETHPAADRFQPP